MCHLHVRSIACGEKQTLVPGTFTLRLPGIDWILQLTAQLTAGGRAEGIRIDSRFWQTAAVQSRASRAGMRLSCQSRQMRRGLVPILGAAPAVCR